MAASIIFGVLEDEYNRLLKAKEGILQFPKGSLRIKIEGGREYLYFRFRENGKTKEKYIARCGSKKAREFRKSVERRCELDSQLVKINKDLKELAKALKKDKS